MIMIVAVFLNWNNPTGKSSLNWFLCFGGRFLLKSKLGISWSEPVIGLLAVGHFPKPVSPSCHMLLIIWSTVFAMVYLDCLMTSLDQLETSN